LIENHGHLLDALKLRTRRFFEQEGRRPRVLVGVLNQSSATHPVERIGALLADIGFDVDLHPVSTPARPLAAMALDNDVHALVVLGVPSAAEPLVRDLLQTLASGGGRGIVLALDHREICDRLRNSLSQPLLWLSDSGPVSVARLLAAIEGIRCTAAGGPESSRSGPLKPAAS
jgi:methylmalonyl-CoA mutase cobalamin-binding subunit